MNDTSKLSPDASPLRIANFRAYWLSRLSMTLAQYAMMLIIGWQTYNIARDSGLGVAEASGLKRLTYMPFAIKAASMALQQYPILNATVNDADGPVRSPCLVVPRRALVRG